MRTCSILSVTLVSVALLLVSGCGGQKTNGADVGGLNTAVTIAPADAIVTVGVPRAYSAQNVFGSDYAWAVIPSTLGTFSASGTFTATTPGTGVVVATSRKDSRYVGTTGITTVPAPVTTVTAPEYVDINATGLIASVPAQADCTYAWSITGGAITSATDTNQITFTAPATAGSLIVACTVTNTAGAAAQGSATVQVVGLPSITSFTGLPVIVTSGGSTYLTAVFQGGTGVVTPGTITLQSGVPTLVGTLSTTTAFTLTVSNLAGAQATAHTTILVGDPDPPGTGTVPGDEWTDPATGLVMVWCPAGTFAMGGPASDPDASVNEGPVHTVTFAQGFWISKTKITQAQWLARMANNPAFFQPTSCTPFASALANPVEQVSWEDAQAFFAALNARVGWSAYRLPSEAEWEYAYRAGTTTRFFWGADPSLQNLATYAWYKPNAFDLTQAVNQLAANAWNLKDMAGNALEWIADAYQPDYEGAPTDGTAVLGLSTGFRGLRGSAWHDAGANLRASTRYAKPQTTRFRTLGLRVVRPHRDAPVLSPLQASTISLPAGGGPVTLTWTASGATSLALDNGVGDVTGTTSKVVQVTATTTFSLVAKSASGWMMSTVRVVVAP